MKQKVNKAREAGVFGSILGGTLSLTLSTLAVKVLGLIYKIPLSHILGDEGMGYFNSAYTVFGLFYLLCTAGVPKAIMILCSEVSEGNPERSEEIKRIATRAFFVLGLGASVLFFVLAFPLARLIGNRGAAFTMLSIAPSLLFVALGGVARGYLSARARFLDIAVSGVLEGAVRLALGLIFGLFGMKLNLPLESVSALTILGTTFGAIVSFIHLYICSKSSETDKKTGQSEFLIDKREILQKLFKISIPITLSSLVMSLTNVIDLGLVMRRLTDIGYSEEMASSLYGNYTTLAVSMFNFAMSIITPISIIFLPHFTNAISLRDNKKYSEYFESALNLVSFIAAPITLGLAVYSYEILALIFGKSAALVGGELLTHLTPAIALSSVLLIINTALEAEGYVKAPIYSMVVGGGVKALVGFLLIGDQRFGILGAPVGTVFSFGCALSVSLIYYYLKTKRSSMRITTPLSFYLASAAAAVGSKVIYLPLKAIAGELFALLACVLLCALIYLGFSMLFALLGGRKTSFLSKYTKLA